MPAYTPAQGNGSLVVNGQIVPVPMMGQFLPTMASAPFYKGNGQGPPTVPVSFNGNAMGSGAGGMDAVANRAASNPWSFTQSPVIIALIFLIVGLLGLRYIHWRR